MSAAAPPPPPHIIPPSSSTNGYEEHTTSTASSSGSGASGYGKPSGQGAPPRLLPHINDLAIRAKEQVSPYMSIEKLLSRASEALSQAHISLEFRRLDHAYLEYLTAQFIVADIIPRHKDQPMLADRGRLFKVKQDLVRKIYAEQDKFDQVGELIIQDNKKSGIQPSLKSSSDPAQYEPQISDLQAGVQSTTPQSLPSYIGSSNGQEKALSRNEQRYSTVKPLNQDGVSVSPPSPKPKPPIHPKPQQLHGHHIDSVTHKKSTSTSSAPIDALTERFSRLRGASGGPRSSQDRDYYIQVPKTNSTSPYSIYPATAIQLDRTPRSSVIQRTSVSSTSTMPTQLPGGLPKPPSPTYNPASDSYSGSSVPPTRSSTKSNASAYNGTMASEISISRPSSRGPASLPDGGAAKHSVEAAPQSLPTPRRRKMETMAKVTDIGAEMLYDYLKTFAVLVIDVRSRQQFDSGHIFTQNIMCVEPASLRLGMSADQLQDSLVLSPESEQVMFDRRADYDLVIYYDESTNSTDYLRRDSKHPNGEAMRYLHEALDEFNQEKPLQWPPVLLVGGINAWSDLVGVHGLMTSNTLEISRKQSKRESQTVVRTPLTRHSTRLSVQKKRHRDYNPLKPEEVQDWRESARKESVYLDKQTLEAVVEGETVEQEAYMRNYDDFYHRFPEVGALERQSMTTALPPQLPPPRGPPPPPPVHKISYPIPPIPGAPSRPAPAVPRPSYGGVSERLPTQTSSISKASQLPPYIPHQYQPQNRRLPRTGLHNFGVTCYMNSTLQCLSATVPMSMFFLSNEFQSCMQRDNWKGSKGLMPELYNTLLLSLWKGDVDTIRPTSFRKFCSRLNSEWGLNRQQDAKEFLDFLVDYLHEDLNINWARTPLKELTPQEEALREQTPPFVAAKKEWMRYTHRDQSYLTSLFAGQHISRLRCATCHNSSTTYEPFTSISVEIPRATANASGRIDIYDCLRSYCSAETLAGEEAYRCPHCKKEREATKRITITRAPEFLVFHFKRFSASHSQSAKKVHVPIDFPLHGLDLEPFMLPPPDEGLKSYIAKRYGAEELASDASMTLPYKYECYAVLRHLGSSLTSGHYISLVRDPVRGVWRKFDDDRVNDFVPEELPWAHRLQNEQAYIVFYQRVHNATGEKGQGL